MIFCFVFGYCGFYIYGILIGYLLSIKTSEGQNLAKIGKPNIGTHKYETDWYILRILLITQIEVNVILHRNMNVRYTKM